MRIWISPAGPFAVIAHGKGYGRILFDAISAEFAWKMRMQAKFYFGEHLDSLPPRPRRGGGPYIGIRIQDGREYCWSWKFIHSVTVDDKLALLLQDAIRLMEEGEEPQREEGEGIRHP